MRLAIAVVCVAVGLGFATPVSAQEGLAAPSLVESIVRAPGGDTVWVTRLLPGGAGVRVIESFDGESWTQHSIDWAPDAEDVGNLTMLAENDGWATLDSHLMDTKVAHWNGTEWVDQTPADLDATSSGVQLAGNGPSNVWLWGDRGGEYALWRWDGDSWHNVPAPDAYTYSLVTVSPTETWLFSDQVWRWNGTEWSQAPQPPQEIYTATAGTDGQLWGPTRRGAVHWDGDEWSLARGPVDLDRLDAGADATASGAFWSVTHKRGFDYLPRIVRVSGSTVTAVDAPVELCGSGARLVLSDVAAEADDDVYVGGRCVHRRGNADPGDDSLFSFVAHYDGQSWTRI